MNSRNVSHRGIKMEGLLKLFFTAFIGAVPWLSVYVIFGYIAFIQEKRREKQKEERKRGIIRTHYVIKSEIILIIIFVVLILFSGGCAIVCVLTIFSDIQIINRYVMKADMWCIYGFVAFALVGLVGTLNTLV